MTTTDQFDGERAFVLRDGADAEAWVLPGVGANCIAFHTPVAGAAAHLLSTPDSLATLRSRPTFWGFPILSPYPGRHQTPFTWHGSQYAIQPNDRPGVAIHGIVAGAPWDVVDASDSRLTCRFDSESFPGRTERWPWPFSVTARHSVERGALLLELEVENRSEETIPHLLGLHPYFPIRFAPAGTGQSRGDALPTAADLCGQEGSQARDTCKLWVAADELWEMKAGLGTGSILRLEGNWDLRQPKAVAELERTLPPPAGEGWFGDDSRVQGPRLPVMLFGKRGALRLHASGADPNDKNGVISGIDDVASGIRMTLDASAGFGSLAIFCPPGQPFVSLEPRSAVSDALTLMNDPRQLSTGIWPLEPGATWKAWARVSAAPIAQL